MRLRPQPLLLALLLALLFGCAAAPPPPPPAGMVSEALQRLEDPLGAVGDRVAAMGPLLEELDDNPSADEALFRLAREAAELLGRTEFSHVPVLAGRLRTQVFFIARGNDEERSSAIGECDRLLTSIRQRFQGGSEAGPHVKPDTEKSH